MHTHTHPPHSCTHTHTLLTHVHTPTHTPSSLAYTRTHTRTPSSPGRSLVLCCALLHTPSPSGCALVVLIVQLSGCAGSWLLPVGFLWLQSVSCFCCGSWLQSKRHSWLTGSVVLQPVDAMSPKLAGRCLSMDHQRRPPGVFPALAALLSPVSPGCSQGRSSCHSDCSAFLCWFLSF